MMEQELEKRNLPEASESDEEKWVRDGSVDYQGRVPLRSSTGAWKASLFIIAIEFAERLTYFSIVANLISYLMKVIHQDLKTAAKNVNYWTGVTTLMPLIGGFLADSYTGRFNMVMISSFIYLVGLSFLTMSQFVPTLQACNKAACDEPRNIHKEVFFIALYCLSLGTGGHKPCLESFGADQFDDNHLQERKRKMSFFNWWNFALCSGLLLGVTVMAYVQDNVNWGFAYLILTIFMAFCTLTFFVGRWFYRYRLPQGSPLKPMAQVLVAAIKKRKLNCPSNPSLLYEVPKVPKNRGRFLGHTSRLRCLDKAAILDDDEAKRNPWRLATVTQVEETKLVLGMIPIWLTSLMFGLSNAQSATFFVKQAMTMNRKLAHNFDIPPASIAAVGALGLLVFVTIYDKILVPILRRTRGNERGITILQRIGIGLAMSVLAMIVAALVEKRRLRVAKEEIDRLLKNPKNFQLSMSVFWLAPQYLILGIGDVFGLVGLQEYFYDQVPDTMRSLGIAFYLSVIGAGSFLGSVLITVIDHTSDKFGKSWFGKDLNSSRLDNVYWTLTGLNVLNLCVYVFLARRYTYKNVEAMVAVADCYEGNKANDMA